MYSQIAGCYIYGYTYYYKSYFHDSPSSSSNHPASLSLSSNQPSPPLNEPSSSTVTATISKYTRCKRIIYLGITTGLCGSITSFSSWQLICNNNLILQWDITWGNSNSSYNGGRFIEWMVSLWAGIVIPVAALRFGIFTASLLSSSSSTSLSSSTSQPSSSAVQESLCTEQHQHQPQSNNHAHIFNNTINSNIISYNSNNNFQSDCNNSSIESIYDILIILMFIISLLLVTILPTVIYPQWTFLTYTAGK